jgi:hypothetical protein
MAAEEISFSSFFFWIGLTVAGIGGYMWYDATIRWKRLLGMALTIGGVLCSLLAVTKVNAFLLGVSVPSILGPLLLLVSWGIVGYDIYLKKRRRHAPMSSLLTIHAAHYGTGPEDEQDVSERLQLHSRDGLVLDVSNSNLVDRDPAEHRQKRLTVEYSYGNRNRFKVTRPEGSRLILPEDSWLRRQLEAATEDKAQAEARPVPVADRPTSVRLQFNAANTIPLQVGQENIWRWYALRSVVRIMPKDGPEKEIVSFYIYLTFDRPIKFDTTQVDSGGAILPLHEVKDSSERTLMVAFNGDLVGMIVNIQVK